MSKIRKINGKKLRSVMEADRSDTVFPNLHIGLEHLPEARKWKIGSTYEVTLHVKQTSIHEDQGRGSAGFDIVGIGVAKKNPVSSRSKAQVKRHTDDKDDA